MWKEEWLFKRRKYWYLVCGVTITLIILSFVIINHKRTNPPSIMKETTREQLEETKMSTEKMEKKYVDVKGEVMNTGVYEVDSDMRLIDVIDLAGGLTDEADQNQVNLAQQVTDEMIIYIPKIGEEVASTLSTEKKNLANNQEEQQLVNINTADVNELQGINGIGLKKAEASVAYREENGLFKQKEDLKNVKGVGEKTFDSLQESITID